MPKPPPRPLRGFMAYLIPFVFIIALLALIAVIVEKNVRVDDIARLLRQPNVKNDDRATVVYVEGQVTVQHWSEEDFKSLSSETPLQPGDTLRTGTDGVVVLRFFEGSEVRVDGSSQLTLLQLDRDDQRGHEISLKVDFGKVWRRGFKGNTRTAAFILNSPHLIVSMNDAAVIDLDASEESIRVIGGNMNLAVLDELNGKKIALKRLVLTAGMEFVVNPDVLKKIRGGNAAVSSPIQNRSLESEWFRWNIEMEEVLGLITSLPKPEAVIATEPELASLGTSLVIVTFPTAGSKISGKILVTGTYNKEKIAKIFVNDEEALVGLAGGFEASLELTEANPEITVTAVEIGSEEKKLAVKIMLQVDSIGPILGKIIQPDIDLNSNGVLSGDKLELIGEVSNDAKKLCVSHNDDEPFCLKQWKPGEKTYKYYGAVKYGNVVKGKNKYQIIASDELENKTVKTVYLFKDVQKPEGKIDGVSAISSPIAVGSASGGTAPEYSSPTPTVSPWDEFPKPVILIPDPVSTIQTSEKSLLINGTADPRTRSILINGKKAPYTVGTGTFDLMLDLEPGENLIKIQAVSEKGEKSKPALLTVIYIEKSVPASPLPTP